MELVKHTQEEGKTSIEYSDDYDQAVNELREKEKERLSIAMSSYHLLYR